MSRLPEAAAMELLADALRLEVPVGGEVYQDDDEPRAIVVLDGLLRLYIDSDDGREVTIRYARSGDVLGLALVLGGPAPVTIQALTPASILTPRMSVLRRLIQRDPTVAQVCASELARHLVAAFNEIAEQAFFTVRQRLARQLLDLATHLPDGTLLTDVTQQQLADSIGSSREVVARAIRELRQAGLVTTSREGIAIRDPRALQGEAIGSHGDEPASPRAFARL